MDSDAKQKTINNIKTILNYSCVWCFHYRQYGFSKEQRDKVSTQRLFCLTLKF